MQVCPQSSGSYALLSSTIALIWMVPWGAFFSVLRTPFNRHFYIWTQGTLSARFFTLQNFVSAFKSKLFVESLIQGNITCQVNRLYIEYEAWVFRVWYSVALTACLRPETHGGWRRRIAPHPQRSQHQTQTVIVSGF